MLGQILRFVYLFFDEIFGTAEREKDRRMNGRSHKAPSLLLVSGVTSQWDQCHLPASGGDSVHS